MEKKIGLYVLGGIVAGMAAIPVISNINYYLREKISKRIRKEIDDYEFEKMLEEDEDEEDEEEYEDLFDKDLDEDFSMDFGSTFGFEVEDSEKKHYDLRNPISKEQVKESFIILIEEAWLNEDRYADMEVEARQNLVIKEIEPILDKIYDKVLAGMKYQNELIGEINSLHQKDMGKNMIDMAACKIMDIEMVSNRRSDYISVVVGHELWLCEDGQFILVDRIIEGNDYKSYDIHIYVCDVYERYDLNITSEELIKNIKNFAENGALD